MTLSVLLLVCEASFFESAPVQGGLTPRESDVTGWVPYYRIVGVTKKALRSFRAEGL